MCHGLIPLSGLLRTVWYLLISNCIDYGTAWPSWSWYILVEQAGKCRPHLKRFVPTTNFPASVSVSLIFTSTIKQHLPSVSCSKLKFSVIQQRGQFPCFFTFRPQGLKLLIQALFTRFLLVHMCLFVYVVYVCVSVTLCMNYIHTPLKPMYRPQCHNQHFLLPLWL